ALTAALGDPSQEVRSGAIDALTYLGKDAVASLAAALKDSKSSESHRKVIVEILGPIRGPAEAVVPVLALGPRDRAPDVRQASARLLGRLGAHAEGVVPHLAAALEDPEERVRREAAEALHGFEHGSAGDSRGREWAAAAVRVWAATARDANEATRAAAVE